MIFTKGKKTLAAIAAALTFLTVTSGFTALHAKSSGGKDSVKEQIITFLQTEGDLNAISSSSTLFPLRKVPIVATTTLLALHDEPSLLEKLYPRLSKIVYSSFNNQNMNKSGILKGGLSRSDIEFSPALNSLANLELFSLGLIAQRIDNYNDALDLLIRSRRYSKIITARFYNPRRGFFFPIETSGAPELSYSPELLLPLLLDEKLGETERVQMCKKMLSMISEEKKKHGSATAFSDIMKDPDTAFPVSAILATIPEFRKTALPILKGTIPRANKQVENNVWSDFWAENNLETFFSEGNRSLLLCTDLSSILRKDSLIPKDIDDPFGNDLEKLKGFLDLPDINRNQFTEAISTTNKLIARIAKVVKVINNQDEIWKIFDLHRWNTISPRKRRIITMAFNLSIDELKRYKQMISRKFSARSGIISHVTLPTEPIYQGDKINFKASIKTLNDTLTISHAYLQIDDLRWKITQEQVVKLNPGGYPFSFESKFSLPPSMRPGIVTLPIFFDLLCNGKRLELHHVESLYFSKGVNVELSYPEGKKIGKEGITLNVNLRYRTSHDIQGELDGNFLKELVTNPKLPARFIIKKGQDVVSLPIGIKAASNITPGGYPFSLVVSIDNAKVATINDRLVKPIRWFHLGLLSKQDFLNKSAVEFQNELLQQHTVSSGKTIMWREVPWGAIDNNGAVRINMMYSKPVKGCMLLYTAFDALSQIKVHWKIASKTQVSFWLNSDPIVTKEIDTYTANGVVQFRKGINTILLTSEWENGADELLFDIADENGLPPFQINNEVERIIDGFDRLVNRAKAPESNEAESERLKEVIFNLNYPGAKSVSIIGTFNNWDPISNPMTRIAQGTWKTSLYLTPGRYTYKFLINKKLRITDPTNGNVEPDGFGGNNSVLIVK